MSAAGAQVLIVEHEAATAELLREAAASAGLRAQIISNAGDALAATSGPAPDMVLLDLELPRSYGTNLGSALRASWPSARFLLLTELAEDAASKAQWTLKAESTLAKPLTADAALAFFRQPSAAA